MSRGTTTAAPATSIVAPAILLGGVAYGEADRIVTLYTRSHGKVSAMARGARRSRGRFGASLSLFVVAEATLRERRGVEMMTLDRFDAREDYSGVGADVVRMAHASYATELTQRLTVPRQVDAALFDLLVELYRAVTTVPPSADLLRAFELRLLDELGLRPALDRCVACGVDAEAALDEPGAVLDPGRGGLACGRCSGMVRGEGVRPLPPRVRQRLVAVQQAKTLLAAAALPPLDAEATGRAREAMHAVLFAHLNGPLRSLEFIQKIEEHVIGDLDFLSFGEVIVDFFPERQGIALRDAVSFTKHLGGAPANVAVGLARLGLTAGLATLVGADEFGAYLRGALSAEGIDVAALGTHPTARTGITFVAVGLRGERSFTFYRHPSADQLIAPDDVDPALIGRARVFHYGSSTFACEPARAATWKALHAARAAGRIVSSDPNLRPHVWGAPAEAPPIVREALALTDIVKVSDDELPPLVGTANPEAGARKLRGLGVGLVIVTMAERGCWFDGAASGFGHVPAEPVTAVDTTGAGDGFMAGLHAALRPAFAEGLRPERLDRATVTQACAFAHRVAARVVTRFGATAALPRRDDL